MCKGIFSVVPELLLILVEFPVAIGLSWLLFCLSIKTGILSFLFNFLIVPVLIIGGIILYLYIGSRWPLGNTALVGEYIDWIVIDDKATVGGYEGQKIPIREAYEWYIQEKLHFNKPLLEVFLHRHHLF